MSLRIFRTSKTRVTSLPSFKGDRPKSQEGEPEVNKEEVSQQESSVGDMFHDIFGEEGQAVSPDEVSPSASKSHVRPDDEPEDIADDQPPKRQYSGQVVQEGVDPSKASEVQDADLDDLISQVMDVPPEEDQKDPQPASPKRSTSTPSKDDAKDADFGEGLSLITGEDYEPAADNKKDRDEQRDKRSGESVDVTRKGMSVRQPLSGGSSGTTSTRTTTVTTSYSSRFVPNIPASFYKDIQSRLEDLIFKFECLDNEYAALQKISHKIYVETLDVKKALTAEN